MPRLHDETQRFPLIHRKVNDSKSSKLQSMSDHDVAAAHFKLPLMPHRFFSQADLSPHDSA
jgi:hypothetical protein